jgi:hypothetical protein
MNRQTVPVVSLNLFLAVPTLTLAEVDSNWSEGEHLELGEIGAQKACDEIGLHGRECPTKQIFRQDRKMKFSYGELIAAADPRRSILES